MFDAIAYAVAKSASHIPKIGRSISQRMASLIPALRLYPVQTRYGRVYCDLREKVCFQLLRHGEYPHWRADELAIAGLPLTAESVVIDVGANIGITVRIFAKRAGHVHAFEPAPRAMGMLQANTADLSNVTIHHCAISNVQGVVHFKEEAELDVSKLSDSGIEVEAKTIDSLGLAPDFIKIDVEGYEHLVLEGARETLKKHAPVIMFEAFGETARQYCENIIREANPNYRFESIGQGLNHIAWPLSSPPK